MGIVGTTIDATAAIRRLLVRTGFAAAPDAVEAGVAAGFAATVEQIVVEQIVVEPIVVGADPSIAGTPPPVLAPLKTARQGDTAAQRALSTQLSEQMQTLTLWWLDRMVTTPQPFIERRTLLWHGHWATAEQKVRWPAAMLLQNEVERQLGGGGFDVFARAMVVDPALMIWLDATGNTASAPNENLGRELMELFTLGHGNYTEEDVAQAALALTGWRLGTPDQGPVATFSAKRHAHGPQTILGQTREFTADTLVNLLVAQRASPRYLAGRMWGWLVSSTPPSSASLDRIAAAYGPTYDLTGAFRAIFTDPAFLDAESVIVKQPIEYVVGALRSLGLTPSALPAKTLSAVQAGLSGMGQVPFQPPNVGGWPTGTAWLTTAAAQARIKMAAAVARTADVSVITAALQSDRPEAVAALLGVASWSGRTRSVLAAAASDPVEVLTLALIAPEYTVSA